EETVEGPETTLTQEGQLLGTPDFLAPEQIRDARDVDIRADLYALGCTFYFLLTGNVPFPRDTRMDKLDAQRFQEPVPLTTCRPNIPPAVATIVQRLMAKRPEDRFASPAALLSALDAITEESETPSFPWMETPVLEQRRPVSRTSARWPWLLGPLAGLLL